VSEQNKNLSAATPYMTDMESASQRITEPSYSNFVIWKYESCPKGQQSSHQNLTTSKGSSINYITLSVGKLLYALYTGKGSLSYCYNTRSSATVESTARPILVPFESSYATSY